MVGGYILILWWNDDMMIWWEGGFRFGRVVRNSQVYQLRICLGRIPIQPPYHSLSCQKYKRPHCHRHHIAVFVFVFVLQQRREISFIRWLSCRAHIRLLHCRCIFSTKCHLSMSSPSQCPPVVFQKCGNSFANWSQTRNLVLCLINIVCLCLKTSIKDKYETHSSNHWNSPKQSIFNLESIQ